MARPGKAPGENAHLHKRMKSAAVLPMWVAISPCDLNLFKRFNAITENKNNKNQTEFINISKQNSASTSLLKRKESKL